MERTATMPIAACISHALFQWSISLSHTPKIFEHATKKSPIDIHTMILREFVLMSGHSTNVIIITSVPTIDNEAVVVVKTLSRISLEISDWFRVVAVVSVVPAGNVASNPAIAASCIICAWSRARISFDTDLTVRDCHQLRHAARITRTKYPTDKQGESHVTP